MNMCCWTPLLVVLISTRWQQAVRIISLIWLRNHFYVCVSGYMLMRVRRCSHLFGEMTSSFFPGRMKLWTELEARPPDAFLDFCFFFFLSSFNLSLSLSPTPKQARLCPNLVSAAFTCCTDVARAAGATARLEIAPLDLTTVESVSTCEGKC